MRIHASACGLALAAALAASNAAAHSVGWSLEPESRAVVLQFNYGGNDPMAFAEVTVTAPDGRVFQQARADREGKFAFVVPDADSTAPAGNWVIDARDAEGHELRAEVLPTSPDRAASVRQSVVQVVGWMAAASVLLNIGLVCALLGRRPRPIATADDRLRQT